MSFEKFLSECKQLVKYPELLERPKGGEADIALPCFSLGKNPAEIAKEFEEELRPRIAKSSLIGNIMAVGPYLNFYINAENFSRNILKEILKKGEKYGKGEKKKKK